MRVIILLQNNSKEIANQKTEIGNLKTTVTNLETKMENLEKNDKRYKASHERAHEEIDKRIKNLIDLEEKRGKNLEKLEKEFRGTVEYQKAEIESCKMMIQGQIKVADKNAESLSRIAHVFDQITYTQETGFEDSTRFGWNKMPANYNLLYLD